MQHKQLAKKGARLERRSIQYYERRGYTCIRSAGSHGPFDFAAFNRHHLVLVQVKANRWPGPLEIEAMQKVPVPPMTIKLAMRWDDYQRLPREQEVV